MMDVTARSDCMTIKKSRDTDIVKMIDCHNAGIRALFLN